MARKNRRYSKKEEDSVKSEKTDISKKSSDNSSDTSDSSDSTSANTKQNGMNDPSWYTKYPELAFGAGNLPFSEPLGKSLKVGESLFECTNGDQTIRVDYSNLKNDAVAGICTLVIKPSYGYNITRNHPLNVAAQQLYSNVRYVNSGRKNYDACDLAIYNIVIAELYGFINWCIRLYGYAFMYSQRNQYIGRCLIEANKVNPDDLVNNLANFRYWLNAFIAKVSSFAVPADVNIFRRRAYMYANLYTESTTGNIKDQLYQFAPDGFYRFELDGTGKGMAKYHTLDEWANTAWTFQNFKTYAEYLLDNVYGDEDFGLMTGDIIKAYGSNILALSPVPEALIIMPVYEEYTLSQMRNADIYTVQRGVGGVQFKVNGNNDEVFTGGDVYQDKHGNLITAEVSSVAAIYPKSVVPLAPTLLTVTNPTPSVEDVLEASRLHICSFNSDSINIISTDPDNPNNILAICCGSDLCVEVKISRFEWSENDVWIHAMASLLSNAVEASETFTSRKTELEMFHWAPTMYLVYDTTAGNVTTVNKIDVLSNLDNYTSLSKANIANLHEVAMLSLMSVPGVAQIVG